MAITRFRFSDTFHCWTLQEMSFASLNLLVGKSGVGKTNISKAKARPRIFSHASLKQKESPIRTV